MRYAIVVAVLAVAVPIVLFGGTASAQIFQDQSVLFGRWSVYQGRWCANANSGADRVEEDCSFDSLAACQYSLGNQNFGFCTQNPAYFSSASSPVRKKKSRNRR
jgi:hypothetical protein